MYEVVDVTEWMVDEEHAIFPIGARDKQMIWSPEFDVPEGIKPNWPYLFKESISRYPDQYWTELVAYIVSKYLDVEVPRVFPSVINTEDGVVCGSLIEWFYDVDIERFMHAGIFFKRIIPEFDEKTGKQHNFFDMNRFIRTLSVFEGLTTDRMEWIADMTLFDTLIGNTDRHQDNWGVIFEGEKKSRLSPLFDNGTALGHERFTYLVENWTPEQLVAYILKGRHHLRYERDDTKNRIHHLQLVEGIAKAEPSIKTYLVNKLDNTDLEGMLSEIAKLTEIEIKIPFSEPRLQWVTKNILARHTLIKEVLKRC